METIDLNQIKLQKQIKKLLAFLPVVIILVILVITSIYKVNTGEAVVITRFGSAESKPGSWYTYEAADN